MVRISYKTLVGNFNVEKRSLDPVTQKTISPLINYYFIIIQVLQCIQGRCCNGFLYWEVSFSTSAEYSIASTSSSDGLACLSIGNVLENHKITGIPTR